MLHLRGFAILVGFQFAGLGLHRLGAPLPGAVLGLILFTVALFAGLIKLEWVEPGASLLLRHMLLFFVPVILALTRLVPVVTRYWLPLGASLLVSLAAVMLTTGLVLQYFLRRESAGEPN